MWIIKPGSTPEFRMSDPHEIAVDHYRTALKHDIEAMAARWDQRICGAVTIIRTDSAAEILIDGLHRVLATRMLGLRVPTLIYTGSRRIS